MKSLLTVLLFALSVLVASIAPLLGAACFLAGSAALVTPAMLPSAGAMLTVTLTPTILLTNTIRKLFVKVPALGFFSSEFTTERVKKGQTVIGKIRTRPVTSTYDDTTGYKNGAQEGETLLKDIEFTMDQHIHVTVGLNHLNALGNSIQKMEEHVEDSASVIGSAVARYILAKVRYAAFPYASAYSEANSDKDALNNIRKAMNTRGVYANRFGLVNSGVAETLSNDSRIENRYDGRSADTDSNPYLTLRGISGFQEIREDPALDDLTETAVSVTGEADNETFTFGSAHGLAVGDRVYLTIASGGTGLSSGYFFVKTVPSTTTLTLSDSVGGSTAAFSSDITGTIGRAENITGFFATREAIAIKTALPIDSLEYASQLGIPVPASSEIITDPDSGLSMLAYKWFEPGTMNAYITLTCLYGAVAGVDADTDDEVMGKSGHILRTA